MGDHRAGSATIQSREALYGGREGTLFFVRAVASDLSPGRVKSLSVNISPPVTTTSERSAYPPPNATTTDRI